MPDTRVTPSNGVHGLGGTKDADLSNVPAGYTVYTTDKNLDLARQKYPKIDWFACYRIKDKNNKDADVQYTLTFDAPTPMPGTRPTLYYFDGTTAQTVPYDTGPGKGNKARFRATLRVGDPPIGMG